MNIKYKSWCKSFFLHPSNTQTTEDDKVWNIFGNFFFDFARDQRTSSFPVDLFLNPKDCFVIYPDLCIVCGKWRDPECTQVCACSSLRCILQQVLWTTQREYKVSMINNFFLYFHILTSWTSWFVYIVSFDFRFKKNSTIKRLE